MEAIYKSILIKNTPNSLWLKRAGRMFEFIQKTKNTVLVAFLILILVGAPIGIEYILKISYVISFFTVVVIYPFLFMVYKIDKKMMNCKYMP